MKIKLFFILSYFTVMIYYAQVGELSHFDCNYSKEITIPFNYSEKNTAIIPLLNQVVFYSYRDQYTYWYKMTAKTDEIIRFYISAVNDSDAYSAYVYQYNEDDFCDKLYHQKIKPCINPFDVENRSNLLKPIYQTMNVKKDHIYYISILNISLNNCGHQLYLTYNTSDTLKVKALHLPCKTDISTVSIPKKAEIKPILPKDSIPQKKASIKSIIKDTIIPIPQKTLSKKLDSTFTCLVKNSKNLNLIHAKLTIIDAETRDQLNIMNTSIGRWNGVFEKNKTYKLKCTALGYYDLEIPLDANKGDSIDVLLEPLKVGENFIMKSIYFHPNTYALRKESSEELQKLLHYLLDNVSVTIEIQGHTNGDHKIFKNRAYINLGEEWNFQGSSKSLSLNRAETIKKYLISNGISTERLTTKGYGGSKPIFKDPETMDEGQKNIRVEALILTM